MSKKSRNQKRTGFVIAVVAFIFGTFVSASCAGEVLVNFGERSFTDEDFRYFAREVMRVKDLSSVSKDERIDLLKSMLSYVVLADEAREKGLDKNVRVEDKIDQAFRNAVISAYKASFMAKEAEISDAAIREHYRKNPDKWNLPEVLTFRHIFFNTRNLESVSGAEKALKEKEEEIKKITSQIQNGEDFVEAAGKYSESGAGNPEERGKTILAVRQDGKLCVDGKPILKSFQERLDSLKPGEVCAPFKTPNGFEILYLENRRPAGKKTLEEARIDVMRELLEGRNAQRAKEMELRTIGSFKITKNYDYLDFENPKTDSVLVEIKEENSGNKFILTMGQYQSLLASFADQARELMQQRKQARIEYLENRIIIPQCYWMAAQKQGLDKEADLVMHKEFLTDVILAGEVIGSKIMDRLNNMEISETDLRDYWADPKNAKEFIRPPESEFRGFAVVIPPLEDNVPETASQSLRRVAEKTGNDIIAKYKEGWDFETIALLYSEDAEQQEGVSNADPTVKAPKTARPLGRHLVVRIDDTGWMSPSEMQRSGIHSKKDRDILLALKPFEYSPIPVVYLGNLAQSFPGINGYSVLECLGTKVQGILPFEECRKAAREGILRNRSGAMEREVYEEIVKGISYDLNEEVWRKIWPTE